MRASTFWAILKQPVIFVSNYSNSLLIPNTIGRFSCQTTVEEEVACLLAMPSQILCRLPPSKWSYKLNLFTLVSIPFSRINTSQKANILNFNFTSQHIFLNLTAKLFLIIPISKICFFGKPVSKMLRTFFSTL